MGKLRQKLDEAVPGRRFIHTHFGFGYRFQAQPAENHADPALLSPSVRALHPFHTPETTPQQTGSHVPDRLGRHPMNQQRRQQ